MSNQADGCPAPLRGGDSRGASTLAGSKPTLQLSFLQGQGIPRLVRFARVYAVGPADDRASIIEIEGLPRPEAQNVPFGSDCLHRKGLARTERLPPSRGHCLVSSQ